MSLFDDEVESLSMFDPLTGQVKRKAALHRVSVQPLRHAACHRAARGRDHQGRTAPSGWSSSQSNNKLVEAQRIEQRTRFDLEMLAELGFCKGIENYSRHLSGRNRRASRRPR
jgi:excinuclease ABC subunit B